MAFQFTFCLETFILDYLEKNAQTENKKIFDGIIEITLFDGVVGLDYYHFISIENWEIGGGEKRGAHVKNYSIFTCML